MVKLLEDVGPSGDRQPPPPKWPESRPFVQVLSKLLKNPQLWCLRVSALGAALEASINGVAVMIRAQQEHMGTDLCTDDEIYEKRVYLTLNGHEITLQHKETHKLYAAILPMLQSLQAHRRQEQEQSRQAAIAAIEAAQ